MKAEEIFSQALQIKGKAGRAEYLDKACADNPQLRTRVEALLAAHEQAASFLEFPAAELPREAMATSTLMRPKPITEEPGTMVGRYKLLQQIGEGGMGVVYMAEQEKPVRRRVALKIIKPGMDSAQVIARFEAERQALAKMDHPNIARVLDAGCTDTGRPYFVMELVQGIPITKYCDDKQLDTRARLELFIQVCQAVQHAHQKGIIHRDIKPSNVLVMIYDSKPVPKIIDFGVAKALHQQLTEKTMFTQFGAVVGTLEYMSPEQAEMDALGTDTRSDIYSLGVLLYELLTGSTPMDGKKLRSLGYAEMLKTIREVEPPKPSTRLSQSREEMGAISARRHTEPKRLQKMIAGDLDWIVMRCLEKDRTRRYETANGLAMDIQRHLQDEAVLASPPGHLYKFQKLVRRNKVVCTAIACVMLALVIGLAASLWQAERAAREAVIARLAEHEALATLGELRAAAPSIAAEAHALAAKDQFDEAIDKLDYAARLRPDVPDYLLAKADLLETQMRVADAATAYRAALKIKPDDARAKANAELCQQLADAPKDAGGQLSRQSLSRLMARMDQDQRPAAEIMPVARTLGEDKKYLVNYWLDRLKSLPVGPDNPLSNRLSVRDDGLLDLELNDTPVADLLPLAGMPLTNLNVAGTGVSSLETLRGMNTLQALYIGGTQVSDLSALEGLHLKTADMSGCPVTSLAPLQGMPLENLHIRSTGITELSPLVGMPLRVLDVTGCPVTDFTPLHGLPLEICFLQGVRVGDLAFLKGAPLKQLTLFGATDMRDLAVLSDIRTLEILALPTNLSDLSVEDFSAVENLRKHPSIKQLAAWIPINLKLADVPSKDEFWKNWDRDYAWALRLGKGGFTFQAGKNGNGTWSLSFAWHQRVTDLSILGGAAISSLDIDDGNISDLTPVKRLPLKELIIAANPVEDLSPLRGMKLDRLSINGTRVRDLAPLLGMPLTYLDARCDQLTDVSLLARIPSLEQVLLPIHATDLDPLRKLPALKDLSFTYILRGSEWAPACTAAEFWKTWDGLPWARKLTAAGVAFDFGQLPGGFYAVTVHDPNFKDCSIFKGSNNVRQLDFQGSSVADISPLADLPLAALNLGETSVTDLSPLRSPVLRDSLREIHLVRIKVTDFAPVAGCANLELFDASDSQIADLAVVKGLKLRKILISRTPVTDIAVLAGMPLDTAVLTGTSITNISPLLECPNLINLGLPQNALDVRSLHTLANLARISYSANGAGEIDMSADQFWASAVDQKVEPWLAALRESELTFKTRRLRNGSWQLILDDQPIDDLAMLKGAAITELWIARTPVADLSPLRGMKLTNLKISGTKVTDLAPLKGMPITSMTIAGTEVRDLTPLAGMPLRNLSLTDCDLITDVSPLASTSTTLQSLILPPNAKNIEFLRKFPNLKRISYKFDPQLHGPSKTAAEFWAEYDRAGGAPASRRAADDAG